MSLVDLCGALAVLATIVYGVLGGADFGGGLWDLVATGPRKEERRAIIAHAMGPVWEANHVWLIFVVVVMFSAFPTAWAAYATALATPLRLVLVGIGLRGVAFVFRSNARPGGVAHRRWGLVFGLSSLVTPVLLGMAIGAISSGRLRVTGGAVHFAGGPPWLDAVAIAMGLVAIPLCALLAAVYLTVETEGEVREDFRLRALGALSLVVIAALTALPFAYVEAPHLFAGLRSPRGLPAVGLAFAAAGLTFFALSTRRFHLARLAAPVLFGSMLSAWAIAQYPYLIYPDVRLEDAAAPAAMLEFLVLSLPFGLAIVLPSIGLLFYVFKGRAAPVADG